MSTRPLFPTAEAERDALRRLLQDGTCADDFRTLQNVQAQRQRIIEMAMRYVDEPDDWGETAALLSGAVREYRRITGRT